MAETVLVIGNKNYSSWSLRGWLMVRQARLDVEEILIRLDLPDFKDAILAHSPAGRVPILKHAGNVVWDSLATGEYLAEIAPGAGLWPADAAVRAKARSVSAEMHAGFEALRTHMPMDLRSRWPERGREAGVAEDIARILAIWTECLADPANPGPYLFGGFGIADAMYAPVVGRFLTYAVDMPDACRAYADAVWAWPAMAEWLAAAAAEP